MLRFDRAPARAVLVLLVAAWATIAPAQVIERASLSNAGDEPNLDALNATMSGNGRFVVFESEADTLWPGDTANFDVFLFDRQTDTLELVSVASDGGFGDDYSEAAAVSFDGQFVAFQSDATNLIAGDTNGWTDVFVRDRAAGTTERVSVAGDGSEADLTNEEPDISGDGRFVVFTSFASNLVAGDTNGVSDVYVHDRQLGTIERVSVSSAGAEGDGRSYRPNISGDGRYVVFQSAATNLVAGDTNGREDAYLHDRQTGVTERVSLGDQGQQIVLGGSFPAVSAGGRYVVFVSSGGSVVVGDTNGVPDIFLRDRANATTERVSVSTAGVEGNQGSGGIPSITPDGRVVVFQSGASNLVAGDTNGQTDVFARDRSSGTTWRLSETTAGVGGDRPSQLGRNAVSDTGEFTAILSLAANFLPGDTNMRRDAYVARLPIVDLAVDKTSGAFYAPPGSTIDYLVLVENRGIADAVDAQVVDNPPAVLTGVTWTCQAFDGAACGAGSGADFIDETVTIPSGGSLAYTLSGTLPPVGNDPVTNTASVSTPPDLTELAPGNNTDSDTDAIGLFIDGFESVEP